MRQVCVCAYTRLVCLEVRRRAPAPIYPENTAQMGDETGALTK
jgi:hypothetical protein